MRASGRWWRRLVFAVALGVVALLAFQSWLLPAAVRWRTLAALRAAGLDGSDLQIERVTLCKLRMADVSLGPRGRLRLDRLDADYSPTSLRAGRVRRLILSGAEWRIGLGRGGLDLGWPTLPGSAAGGPIRDLPFDEVELRGSSVVLEWNDASFRVPVAGSLRRAMGDHWALEAWLWPASTPVGVRGTVELPSSAAGGARPCNIDLKLAVLGWSGTLVGDVEPQRGEASLTLASVRSGHEPGPRFTLTLSRQSAGGFLVACRGQTPRGLWTGDVAFRPEARPVSGGIEIERMQFHAQESDVSLPAALAGGGGLSASRLSADFDLRAVVDERSVAFYPRRPVELGAMAVRVGGESTPALQLAALSAATAPAAEAAPLRVEVRPRDGAPLLRIAWAGDDRGVRVEGDAVNVGDWRATSAAATADLRRAKIGGRFAWDAGGRRASGALEVQASRVAYLPAGLTADEVAASVPFAWGDDAPAPGAFHIDGLRYRDTALPAVSGTARLADGRAELTAAWPVAEGTELAAKGWLDTAASPWTGRFHVAVPPFAFAADGPLAASLREAAAVDASGTLGLEADAVLEKGELRPLVRMTVRDAAARSTKADAEAQGISGVVTFDGVSPLSTPGNQRLTAASARVGGLTFHDGTLAFRLESSDALLLERMRWGLEGGGTASVSGLRLASAQPETEMEVYLEDISIRQWMSLVAGDRVTGEGRLYGRVPVTLRSAAGKPPAARRIEFGEGFLYAPPGTRGWFEFREGREPIERLLNNGKFGETPGLDAVRRRLADALVNFEYSMFRFDMVREGGELLGRMQVAGQGRQGPDHVPIGGLTINLHNFGETLAASLGLKTAADSALDRGGRARSPERQDVAAPASEDEPERRPDGE